MGTVGCDKRKEEMSELVARTGRHQQRYEDGCRLIAGCIPFRHRSTGEACGADSGKIVEVLMITSNSGPGLLFPKKTGNIPSICPSLASLMRKAKDPLCDSVILHRQYFCGKGGWENDETVEEAARREAIEEAGVKGDILGFVGYYNFKSKTLSMQDESSKDGLCKAAMFALLVKEELPSWPEKATRRRRWLTIAEASNNCRHPWMRLALQEGFLKWHASFSSSSSSSSTTSNSNAANKRNEKR